MLRHPSIHLVGSPMIPVLRRTSLGLAFLGLAFAGCSQSVVKVKGKLLKNGAPMVVSEDTYVTLQFVPEKGGDNAAAKNAKFDQKTGTYTVELPPGKYRTMIVVALPSKQPGKLSAPVPPVKSDKVYDLTKDQELDIDVPGK
jgi:hypothetical protein